MPGSGRGPARGVLGGGPLIGLVGARRCRRFGLAERRQGLVHRRTRRGAVIVLECLGSAVDGSAGLLKRLAFGRLKLAAIDRLTGAGELVAGRLVVLTIAGKRLIGVLQGAERVGQVLVGGGRRGRRGGVAAVELGRAGLRGCGSPMLRRGRPLVSVTSIGSPPIALMSFGKLGGGEAVAFDHVLGEDRAELVAVLFLAKLIADILRQLVERRVGRREEGIGAGTAQRIGHAGCFDQARQCAELRIVAQCRDHIVGLDRRLFRTGGAARGAAVPWPPWLPRRRGILAGAFRG